MSQSVLDVVIVGAGISGLGAGFFLQRDCPDISFAIIEARKDLGGTWDLFRYPGVRSDSDMYTLGYSFKPWTGKNAIADGPGILAYLNETADEFGLREKIKFEHKLVGARWSSDQAVWQVTMQTGNGALETIVCRFLFLCSGYYDYDRGHLPHFAGSADFKGDIIHPQFWPDTVDLSGKRVVVIGSGATAVTLVPALAQSAQHVTMLQRTPSYLVAQPSVDRFAAFLQKIMPANVVYKMARWRSIALGAAFFQLARRWPGYVKAKIAKGIAHELGEGPNVLKHFQPPYNPWRQRLCLVPDSDFFKAMRAGTSEIVTDHIDHFDANGIQLTSGQHLDADIIVTATGLSLKFLAGAQIDVDGKAMQPGAQMTYKGVMYAGIPNLATSFGYTNASWTLKSDLAGEYVARLLREMKRRGADIAVPIQSDPRVTPENWVDFSSGYFQRSLADVPKQGSRPPWQLHQNYFRDVLTLRYGAVDDGVMHFGTRASSASERT